MPASKKLLAVEIRKGVAVKMMKDQARELSLAIRDSLPAGYSHMLILREDGSTVFFTDAERGEAIRVLRGVLEELEGS